VIFNELLETEALSELIRYRSGDPKDAVSFSGTLRKHPYDGGRCILFADRSGSEPAILEFRKEDIKAVEELPSLVDETGHSRPVMRLWIRKGSLGVRYEPFEVDEPLRFPGGVAASEGSRVHDHVMTGSHARS
jgi:inorganic pyrophosphatase